MQKIKELYYYILFIKLQILPQSEEGREYLRNYRLKSQNAKKWTLLNMTITLNSQK